MTMATDPICQMEVNEEEAEARGLTSRFQGETYYFCSLDCMGAFDAHPSTYVKQDVAGL